MDRMTFRRGFTLIELMLVVAIIGLLAAIALPKFADLVRKSQEASMLGKLGALRSAVSIYYSDNEGRYFHTTTNAAELVPKYISEIPILWIPGYPEHFLKMNRFNGGWDAASNVHLDLASKDDPDAYEFVFDRNVGILLIDCTHTDTKGRIWTTY